MAAELVATPLGGWRAYARLFRLPNVFTAVADVGAGFIFTQNDWQLWPCAIWLGLASAALYTAGMVLNDVYDVDVDRQERPTRPLPAGQIAVGHARWLGWELLFAGVALGWAAAWRLGDWRPGVVASGIAAGVWLYDGLLKSTPLGPWAMAACRFGNMLLGMSLAPHGWSQVHFVAAGGMAVYILGVCWFAQQEAGRSKRVNLAGGLLVLLAGLAVWALLPRFFPESVAYAVSLGERWYLLWILLATSIAWRCLPALWEPEPKQVQAGVKHCLLSIIVLDAVLAVAPHGPVPGAWLLLLLPPAMFLGRWVYST